MSGTMIRASPMPMASGERRRTVFLSPTVVRLETDWRHRTDSPCRGPFGFRRALHGGNDRLSIVRAGGGIRTRTPLRAADFSPGHSVRGVPSKPLPSTNGRPRDGSRVVLVLHELLHITAGRPPLPWPRCAGWGRRRAPRPLFGLPGPSLVLLPREGVERRDRRGDLKLA